MAAALVQVEHVHELPQKVRVTIIDILGHELVHRGADAGDDLNDYGRALEALNELGTEEGRPIGGVE